MTTQINLVEVLTDEQYEFLFGLSDRYEQDFLTAISNLPEGETLWQGTNPDYGFPNPCWLTEADVMGHVEAMRDPCSDEEWNLEGQISECINKGMEEVPEEIIKVVKQALAKI
jgi:hypothetical protein